MGVTVGCETDDVLFGPPGGLRARREGNTDGMCPIPAESDGSVCPDWTTEIYPLFDEEGPYGCALASCHGVPPGGSGLFMPPGDAATAWDNMAVFENAARSYVGEEDSYILCNLSPDPDNKIGSLMPLVGGPVAGLVEGDDLIALGDWVLCGSPKEAAP